MQSIFLLTGEEQNRELCLGLPERAGKSYEPLRSFIPMCERDCPQILYFERKFLQDDYEKRVKAKKQAIHK